MGTLRSEFSFPSVVGDCEINALCWLPEDGEIRGVVQLIHGMMEHIHRYDPVAEQLNAAGYAVYGHSHLGHGKSINDDYPFGYFGRDNETGHVFREDTFQMTKFIQSRHPGLPIVLFGYSMGSFVCRTCIGERGEDYAAAVICATGGPHPDLKWGIFGSGAMSVFFGKKPGKLVEKNAFGRYEDRTEHRTNSDWLSPDPDYVDKVLADPECGFTFSNQGFHDLFTMIRYCVSDEIYSATPKDLPILLISGEDDPVGSYGELVKASYESYLESGHTNVTMKLYPGRRHEIHLDPGGHEVIDDVLSFLKQNNL